MGGGVVENDLRVRNTNPNLELHQLFEFCLGVTAAGVQALRDTTSAPCLRIESDVSRLLVMDIHVSILMLFDSISSSTSSCIL